MIISIGGEDIEIIFSPENGGWYAEKEIHVTTGIYDTEEELMATLESGECWWNRE